MMGMRGIWYNLFGVELSNLTKICILLDFSQLLLCH